LFPSSLRYLLREKGEREREREREKKGETRRLPV